MKSNSDSSNEWNVERELPSGWAVRATWASDPQTPDRPRSVGPERISLWLADDADSSVLRRGLTSGVMRNLERTLREMAGDLPYVRHTPNSLTSRDKLVLGRLTLDLISQHRRGPKSDAYYRTLLRTRRRLEEEYGFPNPVAHLAEALDIPVATVRTQLRAARDRGLDQDDA